MEETKEEQPFKTKKTLKRTLFPHKNKQNGAVVHFYLKFKVTIAFISSHFNLAVKEPLACISTAGIALLEIERTPVIALVKIYRDTYLHFQLLE